MCEPTTLLAVTLAVSAASAGLSIHGQEQQRKAQNEYQNLLTQANDEQMRQNRDLATRAYLDQANAEHANLAQTRESLATQNFDHQREGAKARGAVLAAAAEGGVAGLSLESILGDFHRQENLFLAKNEQNLLFKEQSVRSNVLNYKNQAEGRIAQVKPYIPSPIKPVDYYGPALSVFGNSADALMRYQAVKRGKTGNE